MSLIEAEFIEKRKHLMSQEQNIQNLKNSIQIINSKILALQREERISQITQAALKGLPQESNTKVYQRIGRSFINKPKDVIFCNQVEFEKACSEEREQLSNDYKIMSERLGSDEKDFQLQLSEFKDFCNKLESQAEIFNRKK